ncbi:glycolate oxidase subunit GlcE [Thioflexithrix psekupsensis]|uniref:Glycolate oxidase subunit GlcE n=1 Tax=Thioflexithrix psekupsensis TaxID=1570016 RepID=A0A251X5S1_9GAMM|nr:glycolate oxidase subunit GlcE [Thioflexithrix psekupsensis]OUD12448.1 glycolate oxidase subunit GlcE [Thioflexithrix psekupsensis]
MRDLTGVLQNKVRTAIQDETPLELIGGGSKRFYGREPVGEPLYLSEHAGIMNYEPSELVITARAGTRLQEIETTLAESGQCLGFEPPHFGENATLGGTIACGFSGMTRPYWGSAADFVLGTRLLTGKAEVLRFGGEVMKNVAGYDVSRLMVGALGTLGILLDVSLKVLPKPVHHVTLTRECDAATSLRLMNQWAGQPLPLSATAFLQGQFYYRLSGSVRGVDAAVKQLGGDVLPQADTFWRDLREHRLPFFQNETQNLWRLSLPSTVPVLPLLGESIIEWGGAQRWLRSDTDAMTLRNQVSAAGGYATLFRFGARHSCFQPLSEPLLGLHQQLKIAFDPKNIFNRGRLYEI